MDLNIFKDKKNLHFIGIGGSGMFPLVQILHSKGFSITGSDNNESSTLELVRSMGIKVTLGHFADNAKGSDLVIYTAAIMPTNPELAGARELGIACVERSEILGLVSTWFNNAVCVSGTHGKTTTTAMLTSVMLDCGFDPSAVIGGKLPRIGGNGRLGATEHLVLEACEYVDTFLKLSPDVAVILNIDADHLEYFKTLDNIIRSFNKFAALATKFVVVNGDDQNSMKAVNGLDKRIVTFGLGEHNIYRAVNIKPLGGARLGYTLAANGKELCEVVLSVPGTHNVGNSLAVMAVMLELGANPQKAAAAVTGFKGAGRRFEILGEKNGFTVADDYAHHPAEIATTLRAAMQMGYRNVWAVFQPFTFSRTSILLDDFAEALSIADRVVLSPIMGAREVNTYNIYSEDLARKIEGCTCLGSFEEMAAYILANAQEGDLVLTLGCGDVYKCAHMILK